MNNWVSVLITIAFILVIKTSIIYAIARIFGYSNKIGLLTGLGLFQLGEFGFILAKGGMDNGMVSEYFYSLMLASSVTTMILTPLIMSLSTFLLKRRNEMQSKKAIKETAKQTEEKGISSGAEAQNRIIIAGYGEVGQNIAESLKEAGVPFLVIDDDPLRISQAKFEGHPRIFGDATNIHVLTQADIKHSKILVVTYPDLQTVISTINLARQINPEIIILTRAGHKNEKGELNRLGVKSVIVPEWEASYTFAKTLLKMSDIETQERSRVLSILRKKS
jgi:CPA2 family monovalent cation:H+ antiporter-2